MIKTILKFVGAGMSLGVLTYCFLFISMSAAGADWFAVDKQVFAFCVMAGFYWSFVSAMFWIIDKN